MGDFLGFEFGGVHSSELGITRVSGGDRYEEQLHPEIKDRTAEVPGVNGEYYFGSDFGPKSFDIEIAFDHLTELQFRKLRKTFGTKHIQPLVFDERPYKYYMAKLESPVELSYICFDEPKKVRFSEKHKIGTIDTEEGAQSGEVLTELPDGVRMIDDGEGNRIRQKVDPWVYEEGTERIYKGEGKMTFICHYPFAKSNFKVLPVKGKEYYEGSEEWAISSGILSAEQYTRVDKYNDGNMVIYNAGDVPTGFRLYCPFDNNGTSGVTLTYTHSLDNSQAILKLKEFEAKPCKYDEEGNPTDYDVGFLIDTNNGLIMGIEPQTVTTSKIITDPGTGAIIETTTETSIVGITTDKDGNKTYNTTGNLYNEYVDSGYFFKFEPDMLFDTTELNKNSLLQIENGIEGIEIFYDYLYF